MEITSVLLKSLAALVVLVLPVMLAARVVQARNQGVFAAGFALLAAAAVDFVVGSLFIDNTLSFAIRVGIVGFVFSQILGTDYLRGLAMSLMWGVFSLGIVALLGLVGLHTRMFRT